MGHLPLVFGGRLAQEYAGCSVVVKNLIQELHRSGRALRLNDALVEAEEVRLKQGGLCRSNDPHVMAVAKVAQARLVCTNDAALREDFRDRAILNKPRGKLWSPAAHSTLRRNACDDCNP
jgi:hypothetical protein